MKDVGVKNSRRLPGALLQILMAGRKNWALLNARKIALKVFAIAGEFFILSLR